MNPQLLSQKMIENAALLNLYQGFGTSFGNIQTIPNQQMNYQAMLLKARTLKFMQLKAMCVQNMLQSRDKLKQEALNFKEGPILKVEPITQDLKLNWQKPVKAEEKNLQLSPPAAVTNKINIPQKTEPSQQQMSPVSGAPFSCDQINFDSYLKAELEKIIRFILSNMGKSNQKAIEEGRNLYTNNPTLLQVYDKLVMKYFSAKKCKEDIVRYILRKAFKMMRASLMKKEKINGRKASLLLCKRYFQSKFDEIEKAGVNVENEDELLEFCMPYKKNSKNKTMNTSFVLEIFSSEDFCQEYQVFLNNLPGFLEEDNSKKMKKLITFIMECVKGNAIHKLGSFNRLPWLDVWDEDTKNIAIALMPNKRLIYTYKKPHLG